MGPRRADESRRAASEMVAAEHADLRALVQALTPAQWAHPSLCDGWTVRDVVAHLVAWDRLLLHRGRRGQLASLARFAWLYGTSLGSMRVFNARLQRRTRALDREELAAELGAGSDGDLRRLFEGTAIEAHLAEYVIHGEDIRRPLGLPPTTPPERVEAAVRGVRRLPGVRAGAKRRAREATPSLDELLRLAGRLPAQT